MKTLKLISYSMLLLIIIVTTGCGNIPSQIITNNGETDELTDAEVADIIDEYGGHPFDPGLPEGTIGVSDEMLEEGDMNELRDVILYSIDFAKKRSKSNPRYVFELGRIAYFLDGYESLSYELLSIANKYNYAPAKAYMAYYYEDNGEYQKAIKFLKESIKRGFKDPKAMHKLNMLDYKPKNHKWNKVDFINALYKGNFDYLKRNEPHASIYMGQIQNQLWSNEIIFINDDSSILLELDPEANKNLASSGNLFVEKTISIFLHIQSEAVQDARLLAMLYSENPRAFRIIYGNLAKYLKENKFSMKKLSSLNQTTSKLKELFR